MKTNFIVESSLIEFKKIIARGLQKENALVKRFVIRKFKTAAKNIFS